MKFKQINGIIYMHQSKTTGKVYIGQTILSVQKRWGANGNGYKGQEFYSAIQEEGWDNFNHIILENNITDQQQLNQLETYWIKFYDAENPEKGYNQGPGGNNRSEKSRKKQSNTLKEKWKNDKEFREAALKGLLSSSHNPLYGEQNGMYNVHRYKEQAPRQKQVICLNTGQIFPTIKSAAEWAGNVNLKSHISAVCKGQRNYCGLHPVTKEPLKWEYVYKERKNDYEI